MRERGEGGEKERGIERERMKGREGRSEMRRETERDRQRNRNRNKVAGRWRRQSWEGIMEGERRENGKGYEVEGEMEGGG